MPPSGNRGKWKRKPRDSRPTNSKRQRPPEDDDEEEDEDDNDVVYADEDEDLHPNPNPNLQPVGLSRRSEPAPSRIAARVAEVLDEAQRVLDFPMVVRRTVNRPHPSVVAASAGGDREKKIGVVLENVSYGQLQALSTVPAENAALAMAGDQESSGLYVVTPPSIMEGGGIVKRFWNGGIHVVPMHADWFCPTSLHRLERQVVPLFFSGKSVNHTPEKYMECRNLIVAKYMEHPEKKLSITDCEGMAVGVDGEDMTRIFRFLDQWGIINYCAPASDHESWNFESYLREDANGEVHVPSAALKSIDSLIKFDKPKCRLKVGDVYSSLVPSDDLSELDNGIREKLSDNRCSYCSHPLLNVYFQSTKEGDVMLCAGCYHEGKFVIGHSSIDFAKADSAKDDGDPDVDCWTDQETMLLLEAVEIYNDNWNDIAEHVGSKSKAQCILHFLRLPVENGLLSNIDVPHPAKMSNSPVKDANEETHLSSNGNSAGPGIQDFDSDNRLPFANSGNPVMALVAFLASSVAPRVAAACAHAALAALSEDDGVSPPEKTVQADGFLHGDSLGDGSQGEVRNSGLYRENINAQASRSQKDAEVSHLSANKVENAAKSGLAAAATKAKLFADHEEREIQRLSANIINHQLKRLELKLKQFAEVETLLMKECEQVEKARRRFASERARYLSSRFGSPSGVSSPVSLPAAGPSMVSTSAIIGNRPTQLMSASQPSVSGYNQVNHPNMPFMPRQPAFSYGPRPPLSMMQPSSSLHSPNVMFSAQGQPSLGQPMLRQVSGTSSSHG